MADLDLGALSAQLKLGVEDLDARVKQVVSRLDDLDASTTKAQKKTEDLGKTLKDALKGEVVINAVNRVASAVGQISPEFERASKAIQGTGAVLQGFFQGGFVGAGIAGLGVLTASVAEDMREIQKITDAAGKATQSSLDKMASGYAQVAASLDDVVKKLEAVNDAKKYGITLSEAEFKIRAQELANSIGSLRLSAARSQDLADQAGPGYGSGFRQAAAEANAQADKKQQELELLTASMRLAQEMKGLDKDAGALGKSTKAATKPLSDLARAVSEAMKYSPDQMIGGQAVTPGEMARMMKAFGQGVTTEPGSISEERRARAERNREYAANGSEVQRFSEEQDKKAHERWKSQSDGRTKNDLNTLDDNKSSGMSRVTQDLKEQLKDLEYAVKTAVSGLGSVAPKTATLVAALASEDWGTAIGVIASNSKEFSKLGELLDKGLVDSINAVTSNIRYALPTIKIAIDAIVEVAGLAGNLLGLANVFNGQENKFREMFEAIKYFGFGVSWLSAAVKWVGNAIKDVMADAVVFILESNDITKALFAEQITKLKASKSGQGEFLDATWNASKKWLDLSYDATMAGLNLDDLGGAADKVAQSLLNLPAGFKVNAAIYDAANASGDVWGGYVPPGSTASMPTAAAAAATASTGSVYNFYAPIYVNGDGSFEANVARGAPQLPPPNRPTTYPPNP